MNHSNYLPRHFHRGCLLALAVFVSVFVSIGHGSVVHGQAIKEKPAQGSVPSPETVPELVLQTGHRNGASYVAFSPDNSTVASASVSDVGGGDVRLWHAQSGVLIRVLEDASGPVAFSPDGRTLATQNLLGGSVKLWNWTTGQLLRQTPLYTRYGGDVSAIAFSRDGQRVAHLTWDFSGKVGVPPYSRAHLWNAHTGKAIATLTLPNLQRPVAAFSPDCSLLAVAGERRNFRYGGDDPSGLQLWNLQTGKLLKKYDPRSRHIGAIAYSLDGKTLAVSHAQFDPQDSNLEPLPTYDLHLWDTRTHHLTGTLFNTQEPIGAVSFSPTGRFLAASGGNKLHLWNLSAVRGQEKPNVVELSQQRREIPLPKNGTGQLAFSPDAQFLAVGGVRLSLVRMKADQSIWQSAPGQDRPLSPLVFTADGRQLLSLTHDTRHSWKQNIEPEPPYRLWDTATGTLLPDAAEPVVQAMVGVPGHWHYSEKRMNVADTRHRETLRRLVEKGAGPSTSSPAISPDGKWVAWAISPDPRMDEPQPGSSRNDTSISRVEVWEVASEKRRYVFTGARGDVVTLAFSPDSRMLASSSLVTDVSQRDEDGDFIRTGWVNLWSIPQGKRLHTLRAGGAAMIFSADGQSLICGGVRDGTVKVWNVGSGQLMRAFQVGISGAIQLVASPDGKTLLCDSASQHAMNLWNLHTGRLVATLSGHHHQITAALFTPDGKRIVTGSFDGTLKWWNASSGRLLVTQQFFPREVVPDESVSTTRSTDNVATRPALQQSSQDSLTGDSTAWIAYTPDGHYIGSPDVERFIRWRVGAQLYPASLGARFRRPDLVQKALLGH